MLVVGFLTTIPLARQQKAAAAERAANAETTE